MPPPAQARALEQGKARGAKPPLRPKHVWSIRTKLQIEGRARDLAMFNLAIDSKLRGCDVVAIRGRARRRIAPRKAALAGAIQMDALMRKISQLETAADISHWLSSSGLQAPT
jgi:hypothetical protein